jgi:hypothetical protein
MILRKKPGTQTEWLELMTFHEMSNTVERADRQARDAQYPRKYFVVSSKLSKVESNYGSALSMIAWAAEIAQ